jgi:hypothetical protein
VAKGREDLNDEDAEDSRSGAIQKKAKVDPFGSGLSEKKKKKAQVNGNAQAQVVSNSWLDLNRGTDSSGAQGDRTDVDLTRSSPTPVKKKKKKHKKLDGEVDPFQSPTQSHIKPHGLSLGIVLRLQTSMSVNIPVGTRDAPLTPSALKIIDVSPFQTPDRAQHTASGHGPPSPTSLKYGVLNLDKPLGREGSPSSGAPESPSATPKKKRRKRKRKHSVMAASSSTSTVI